MSYVSDIASYGEYFFVGDKDGTISEKIEKEMDRVVLSYDPQELWKLIEIKKNWDRCCDADRRV